MGTITTRTVSPRRARPAGPPRARAQGLSGALFSATQQRVLSLLFGQPARRFFANELIALAESGSGAAQRELTRLTDSGLISAQKEGNRRYFQANPASPIFEELCSIVRKTSGATEPLRDALNPLRSDLELALLYGSVSRGTDTAGSDLDVLVVSDTLTLEKLYSALASAEKALARKVNVTLYTRKEYRRRLEEKNSFLTRVLSHQPQVLMGDLHGFVESR